MRRARKRGTGVATKENACFCPDITDLDAADARAEQEPAEIGGSTVLLPEEERSGPLDIPLAVALDAGLEDERVGAQVVVGGDGAVLAAAAGVLHDHRHGERDAAEIL